jgi:outer membrane murein-binding lipoprotein Lpp
MKTIIGIAVAAALTLAPALAVTAKAPEQKTVQAQIDALKSQVAALQSQVDHLKSSRNQQVCISLWCA